MIGAWLLFPALLGVLACGWGLLVERLSGERISGPLALPLGLAALIAVSRLSFELGLGTLVATPLAVVVAIAGFVLGHRRGIDRWAAGCAVAVFIAVSAPVLLSGQPTFAGYGVLGDTAVQFALTDALADRDDVEALPASTYRQTVLNYRDADYPVGTHAVLGAVRPLTGMDVSELYQPFLSFMLAMLALCLYGLLAGAITRPPLRALAAFLASQPALVYAFALQGSIKELATLMLVPLLVGVVMALARKAEDGRRRPSPRARELLPIAIVAGAMFAAVGPAAAAWIGPALLVALVLVALRAPGGPRSVLVPAGAFLAVLAILAIPAVAALGGGLKVQSTVLTSQEELGNLLTPLDVFQVVGVWLTGDYRLQPPGADVLSADGLTLMIIGVALLLAVAGVAEGVRRRLAAPVFYLAIALFVLVAVAVKGSPWADAKALVIASPAVVVAVALGVQSLVDRGQILVGALGGLAVAAGILLSNAYAYHDVSLAPHDRLDELAGVGDRLAGRGPTLFTEFEEYARHFAREAEPVGASETAVAGLQPPGLRKHSVRFGFPTDLDSLRVRGVERFPSIVVRRSPVRSRPPAGVPPHLGGPLLRDLEATAGEPPGVGTPAAGQRPERRGRAGLPGRGAAGAAGTDGRGELVAATATERAILALPQRPAPLAWTRRQDDPTLLTTLGAGRVGGPITVVRGRQAGSVAPGLVRARPCAYASTAGRPASWRTSWPSRPTGSGSGRSTWTRGGTGSRSRAAAVRWRPRAATETARSARWP